MTLCFISLGSNVEPEKYLAQAVGALGQHGTVVKVARVWQSAPVGFATQADFCNSAVAWETELEPGDVKELLLTIEQQLGRVRDPLNKHAPRTIDLDLTFYGDEILTIEGREIPDPDSLTRNFVAVPLAELAPEMLHPLEHRSLESIATALGGASELRPRADIDLSAGCQ